MPNNLELSQISFLGAGDCGPTLGPEEGFPIDRYTTLIRPILESVDLRFANCERQYSGNKEQYAPRTTGVGLAKHGCQPPEMAQIFTDCGFDAVTIANNHMYDFGPNALLDTRELLLSKGIQVSGGGKDLAEARAPVILVRKGIRVGILSYCSVLPYGGEAGPDKIGIAPLRVKTSYETNGPHATTRVLTEPNQDDLRMIIDDVKDLRKKADVVMIAFHWGVDWVPRVISDYQVTVAHACIDAGADLIMGHHPHVPKGIEVYKGKAIFYCLGTFCMNHSIGAMREWKQAPWEHGALRNYTDLDPDYPLMPYGKDSSKALMVKAILSKDGIRRVSFLPMMIDKQYRPEVLEGSDPRFMDVVNYMDWASDGFEHSFAIEGDEVVLAS